MQAQENNITVDGYNLVTYTYGSGDNTILLLNGGPGLPCDYLRDPHIFFANKGFKIVAVDVDNNQKKVTVVIDPKKIMQDKDVFKKIKKANKTKVNVDTSGTVQLQSTNEVGSIDKTTTNVLNNNKFTEFLNIEPSEILNVETQIVENKYYLDLPIVKAQNSEEFEIVQEDGQQLPEWIKIDPFTGQIIAEPPSDVDNIKLKIISEKDGGEIVVKEVELEFNKENNKLYKV